MSYVRFSPEQIEQARNTDTVDFLGRNYGFTFKKAGKYFSCKEHDSLRVMSDRKGFRWESKDIGGSSAIDFLMRVDGKSFKDAVTDILGGSFVVSNIPSQRSSASRDNDRPVILPEKTDGKYSRVFAYLSNTRCIAPDVINDMMKEHKLYQDKNGNCVFVGFDDAGKARFGSVRGTLTDKKFRGD